jgi:hypothetical protein
MLLPPVANHPVRFGLRTDFGLDDQRIGNDIENSRKKWVCMEFVTDISQTVKGKAIPVHPWTGPEGSRRLRLPDFKTVGT